MHAPRHYIKPWFCRKDGFQTVPEFHRCACDLTCLPEICEAERPAHNGSASLLALGLSAEDIDQLSDQRLSRFCRGWFRLYGLVFQIHPERLVCRQSPRWYCNRVEAPHLRGALGKMSDGTGIGFDATDRKLFFKDVVADDESIRGYSCRFGIPIRRESNLEYVIHGDSIAKPLQNFRAKEMQLRNRNAQLFTLQLHADGLCRQQPRPQQH